MPSLRFSSELIVLTPPVRATCSRPLCHKSPQRPPWEDRMAANGVHRAPLQQSTPTQDIIPTSFSECNVLGKSASRGLAVHDHAAMGVHLRSQWRPPSSTPILLH